MFKSLKSMLRHTGMSPREFIRDSERSALARAGECLWQAGCDGSEMVAAARARAEAQLEAEGIRLPRA